jgi:TetR/AcrR family transcriptional regulator
VSKQPTSPDTAAKRTRNAKPKDASKPLREPSEAALKRRLRQIESKRASILQAALEVFSRFGVHGSSLDQVANLADISKTNLLYYFSSKDELYLSVLQQLLDVWIVPLQQFNIDNSPVEAIGGYLRAKLELSRDHPAESRLFCMEIMQGAPLLLGELQQPMREKMETKVAVIRHWIDNGKMAPIDPHHLIFSMWAITQHYADFRTQVQAITGKTLDDPVFFEEVLRNIRSLILDGICLRAP